MNAPIAVKRPFRRKLVCLCLMIAIPLLAMIVFELGALILYSNRYDAIVSNMTLAESYNLNFEETANESIYCMTVSDPDFETTITLESEDNPYYVIGNLRSDFTALESITTDPDSERWLQTLLRNIDTLEARVDDIVVNLREGGHYDENIEMLDNNIYILTGLIQENIQYYIYYQTRNMEQMKIEVNQNVMTTTALMIVLIALLCVVAIFATRRVYDRMLSPLNEVGEAADKIAGGDFSARVHIDTEDEIAALGDRVNAMASHLEQNVAQIREDERKMRNAELRLLQEQINPHFFYNTMDTIVWLIEAGKSEEAEDMLVSLSNYFRLVLSQGREFIVIRDEIRHVKSYLEIQQVRYQDILNYEIDVAEDIGSFGIQKMTLQPIVENALYHGIKNKRSKGTIWIRGKKQGDNIVLTVEDNGAGMDGATLQALREKIEKPARQNDTGFGMANVNERIHMGFGPDYGIQVDSKEGVGTIVTLTLPAKSLDEINAERKEVGHESA